MPKTIKTVHVKKNKIIPKRIFLSSMSSYKGIIYRHIAQFTVFLSLSHTFFSYMCVLFEFINIQN